MTKPTQTGRRKLITYMTILKYNLILYIEVNVPTYMYMLSLLRMFRSYVLPLLQILFFSYILQSYCLFPLLYFLIFISGPKTSYNDHQYIEYMSQSERCLGNMLRPILFDTVFESFMKYVSR